MTKEFVIDCNGIDSPAGLWRLYLASVPTRWPEDFGHTLDSFWDAVEWGGPGDPGAGARIIFRNAAALEPLRTIGGKPFLQGLRDLAADTKRCAILVED